MSADTPAADTDVVLAVDIGGTKFAAGLVSMRGELIDRHRVAVDQQLRSHDLFEQLSGIVNQQLERAAHRRLRVRAVGVGSAGPVARNCETISPLNIPAWRDFPLRTELRNLTRLAVFGDLDAKALALAEGWLGAAKGSRNYCAMTVSTGVGGGIVIDGRLLEGNSGNAGHVGHIIVEPGGRRCPCGARGCLEAEASGLAIEAITGRSPTEPTYEIIRRTGMLVGRAAAFITTALDLEAVVIGGSVAIGFGAPFFNAAHEELEESTSRSPVRSFPRLLMTRLGDAGPLIGAGAVGIRGLRREERSRRTLRP